MLQVKMLYIILLYPLQWRCVAVFTAALMDPSIPCVCRLLVAVVTYIVVGSVINLALGKRSATDVFPNYAFWVGFPRLLLVRLHACTVSLVLSFCRLHAPHATRPTNTPVYCAWHHKLVIYPHFCSAVPVCCIVAQVPILQGISRCFQIWFRICCTVYSIKTETFYGCSTSTGTGVLLYAYGRTSLWIRA